jgi:hypothetical protein
MSRRFVLGLVLTTALIAPIAGNATRTSTAAGAATGHVRGTFGTRQDGRQLWYAKVIGRGGTLVGILAGRYGDGTLRGSFRSSNHTLIGTFRGVYGDARWSGKVKVKTGGSVWGSFAGEWKQLTPTTGALTGTYRAAGTP